jgi:hypothetical protein
MALTKGTSQTTQYHGSPIEPGEYSLLVKTNAVIYKGALVCVDSTGYALPGATATGLIPVGRAEETVDNTGGASGAKRVKVTRGAFSLANSADADEIEITELFSEVYIVDDNTVAKTDGSSTRSRAGICVGFEGSRVMVLIGPAANLEVAAVASDLQASQLQKRELEIGFADLTDADGSQSFNLGAALPANAVVVGHNVNVTAVFDNAGDTGTFSLDIGVSGALDSICNGASLNAIAHVNGPLGARSGGRYPSAQLLATVLADVNVTDATKGSAVVEVFYFVIA